MQCHNRSRMQVLLVWAGLYRLHRLLCHLSTPSPRSHRKRKPGLAQGWLARRHAVGRAGAELCQPDLQSEQRQERASSIQQLLKSLYTAFSFQEINPATLSGAIDVIVVEHSDGKDGSKTLACSPFHVRYGKLSVLRPVDRTVYVQINGVDAPYHMKVGDTGEAFFVFETDQDVPADLQTSPLTGPLGDDEQIEPEPLDLGDSISALNLHSPTADHEADVSDANIAIEQQAVESKHESMLSRSLEGAARKVQTLGTGAINVASAQGDRIHFSHATDHMPDKVGWRLKGAGGSDDSLSDPILEQMARKHAVTEEAFVASEFEGAHASLSNSLSAEVPLPFGTDPNEADASPSPANIALPPVTPWEQKSQDLMLDMAGYKMDEGPDADGLKTPPAGELAQASAALDEQARNDILNQADPDVLALTRALLRYSETKNAKSDLEAGNAVDGSMDASKPYLFCITSEGQQFSFEISICLSMDRQARTQGLSPPDEEFDNSRVTRDEFVKRAEILQDAHLFIRFRSRYFGWDNGSPILATLELYRKAFVENQAKLQPSKGTWKRWWGRGGTTRSRTVTDESAGSSNTDPVKVEQEKAKDASAKATPQPSPLPPASPSLSQAETAVDEREASSEPTASESTKADQASADTLEPAKHYAKTLRLTSDQLKALNLKKGANTVSFTVQSSYSGVAVITSRIFLWEADRQVVISDIDGTITKSDALGHVFNMIGRDWTHPGVAKLYTDIASNGYKMLYLTSRAVGQADVTREYLKGISQNGYTLPDGPVIMSPDRLLTSLHREVVLRKPEVFKMACLRDIKRLFVDRNPFYAGFGNRLTDGLSYRSVEIPSSRIFTIDPNGNVKLELLELAGYTSSYIAMTNLVNETFPPTERSFQPAYNDFNYWRSALPEVELPDLTPASPTLSARSDSRMSVFRVGAIAGVISKRASRNHLRSQSSSSSLAPASPPEQSRAVFPHAQRSSSPTPLDAIYHSDNDEEEEDALSGHNRRQSSEQTVRGTPEKKAQPRRRTESMPGSYEDEAFLTRVREGPGEVEEVDESVVEEEEEARESDDEEDEEPEDDLPEMDFGNVPYL